MPPSDDFAPQVTVESEEDLDTLLAGDASEYPPALCLTGDGPTCASLVDHLARSHRPWLRRLRIQVPWARETPLTFEQGVALEAATPRLERLELLGHRLFSWLTHAGVHTLQLSGYDAIESLTTQRGAAAAFPAVEVLDAAFYKGFLDHLDDKKAEQAILAVLSPSHFPAAQHLDLSRCEPGSDLPNNLGGGVSAYKLLPQLELLHQLTFLRLPSLQKEADVRNLRGVLVQRGHLMRVEVARDYLGLGQALRAEFPALQLPESFPWPSPDQVHGREALTVHIHDEPYGHDVDLSWLVRALEQGFPEMTPEVQGDWRRFWADVNDLSYEGDDDRSPVEKRFPFDNLHRAVTACAPYIPEERFRWHELLAILERHRACCAGAQVKMKRYWGW